jgi:PAS domain S-box-containing protein
MAASDLRVLIVAPTGRDAQLITDVLQEAGITSESFVDVEAAVSVPLESAGAMLMTEEELNSESVAYLAGVLAQQPAWSDIPILILSTGGIETDTSRTREADRIPLGITTILERPIRISTLVGSLRAALRTRLRQYEMRDNLERQRGIELAADEAVRRSEAKLSQMADAMPQIVWTACADGSTDYFNNRWYEFTGFDRSLEGDRNWTSIVHPDDIPADKQRWEKAIFNGNEYHSEIRLWDRVRQTWRWHLARAVPGRDASGAIVKWYGTFTDIDDVKKTEENQRQAQKLESIGVLAGGIAHDFNNLLCGILGNLSLAAEMLPAEEVVQQFLREAMQSSERAAELVMQLLAYAGKRSFVIAPVNMTTLVRENIALLHGSIPRNVELRLDLASKLPDIEADASQIQQVVMNLLINAAEAIGKNPGHIQLRTSVHTSGSEHIPGPHVCLEVRDTGCGMDPATKSRIFDPFFTTKFTGRGLGLAAVLGIIRAHKAVIDVQSSPGDGSLFRVCFPLASFRESTSDVQEPKLCVGQGSGTVLVVEDEQVIRDLARAVLERNGYEVRAAENGFEAVQMLERNPALFSVVLLDLTMPVLTGEQALPLIRKAAPKAAVVLSSGFDETEISQQFKECGVSAFLQKPYTARELVEKLHAVLRIPD